MISFTNKPVVFFLSFTYPMILAPPEKLNLQFKFYIYFMSLPLKSGSLPLKAGAEILHFYLYFCLKIILFDQPKFFSIFLFLFSFFLPTVTL